MNSCIDKTQMFFRLQEQKSHYKRIFQAKKIIDFKKIEQRATSTTCAKPNHKYQRFRNRQIKENNLKLFHHIIQIKNKEGLLKSMQKTGRYKKPKTQAIQYLHTNQKIDEQNMKLIKKLMNVKPHVGTIQQWQNDFQRSRINEKRIQKFVKNQSIDPEQYIRQNLSRFSKRSRRNYTSLGYQKISRDINNRSEVQKLQSSTHRDYIDDQQKYQIKEKQKKKKKHKKLKKRNQTLAVSQKLSINSIIMNKKLDYKAKTLDYQ